MKSRRKLAAWQQALLTRFSKVPTMMTLKDLEIQKADFSDFFPDFWLRRLVLQQ